MHDDGFDPLRQEAAEYYANKLRIHGPCAKGADWRDEASQVLRLRQALSLIPADSEQFSLLDYGCGYGALVPLLAERFARFRYLGYDLSEEMIQAARKVHGGDERCSFQTLPPPEPVEYVIASGIWNVKGDAAESSWARYVMAEVTALDAMSIKGFAFNILSNRSDPDKRRPDLYYADPGQMLGFCLDSFSRSVALLHDYPLYEFTVIVRKE